jgi:hypothetical protein
MCSHSVVFQHFMEPEGSLPRSQELPTCTYPEPDQSGPQHSVLFTHCHSFIKVCFVYEVHLYPQVERKETSIFFSLFLLLNAVIP